MEVQLRRVLEGHAGQLAPGQVHGKDIAAVAGRPAARADAVHQREPVPDPVAAFIPAVEQHGVIVPADPVPEAEMPEQVPRARHPEVEAEHQRDAAGGAVRPVEEDLPGPVSHKVGIAMVAPGRVPGAIAAVEQVDHPQDVDGVDLGIRGRDGDRAVPWPHAAGRAFRQVELGIGIFDVRREEGHAVRHEKPPRAAGRQRVEPRACRVRRVALQPGNGRPRAFPGERQPDGVALFAAQEMLWVSSSCGSQCQCSMRPLPPVSTLAATEPLSGALTGWLASVVSCQARRWTEPLIRSPSNASKRPSIAKPRFTSRWGR